MARPSSLDVTLTEDGDSAFVYHPGGSIVVIASGDFGGGTLTLEWRDKDGGSTFALSTTMTAAGHAVTALPAGDVRVSIADSTSPSVVVRLRSLLDA